MKTRKIIGYGILAIILALAFASCLGDIPDVLDGVAAGNSATPFSDEATLVRIAAKDGNVDWRIARFFALQSLQEFRQVNEWERAELSQYPIIIYSVASGEPRYYEFRVIRGGVEIGAITCVVEEGEGEAVQYVLPFANQVSADNARSINANQGKLIDAGYPATLIVRQAGSGRSLNSATGIEDTEEYFVDVKVKEFLEQLDPEQLEFYSITPERYELIVAEYNANQERINNFWEKVMEAGDEILALSEEEILSIFQNDSVTPGARATLVSGRQKILQNWDEKKGWHNPTGWCGPNVATFITLGLGSLSGFAGIPLSNDPNKIDSMYNTYENAIGTGARTYIGIDNALRRYTNYGLSFWEAADILHTFSQIDNHIRGSDLPAISLRMGWSLCNPAWHYRTVIGTRTEEYKQKYTLLLISWYDYYNTNWYYMHDNGKDGPEKNGFWEKAGQLVQFSAARVVRK